MLLISKIAVAFSFCFSLTELQLETVSKAFHITIDGKLSLPF